VVVLKVLIGGEGLCNERLGDINLDTLISLFSPPPHIIDSSLTRPTSLDLKLLGLTSFLIHSLRVKGRWSMHDA